MRQRKNTEWEKSSVSSIEGKLRLLDLLLYVTRQKMFVNDEVVKNVWLRKEKE